MDSGTTVALTVAIISGFSTIVVGYFAYKANTKSSNATAEVQQGANVLEGYDELSKNQAATIKAQEERIHALELREATHQANEVKFRENINNLYKKLRDVRNQCSDCDSKLLVARTELDRLRRKIGEEPEGDI